MEVGLLLDVVVGDRAAVLELFASKVQTLLVRRYLLLVLDLSLDVAYGIGALDLESDGLALAAGNLDKDLHLERICLGPG